MLSHAIRFALPVSVAMQWALRSRYLGRPAGLACLARDGVRVWALLLALVDVPLVLLGSWGQVAATLVPIWLGGTVLTRRGWGLPYAAVLIAGTASMTLGGAPLAVLGALTAITLLMSLGAIRTSRRETDERAGPLDRSIVGGVVGGMVGALLVGDPTVGLGVHGAHPAIALLPSVVGSYWGGYFLWNFFDAVPRGLRGQSLDNAGRRALSDPAMSIFVGAMLRLFVAVLVLSAIVYLVGGPVRGHRWCGGIRRIRCDRDPEHADRHARIVLAAGPRTDRGRRGADRRAGLAARRGSGRSRSGDGRGGRPGHPADVAAAGPPARAHRRDARDHALDPMTGREFRAVNVLSRTDPSRCGLRPVTVCSGAQMHRRGDGCSLAEIRIRGK